jgi:antitoxin component of MazEF toxin-antitoxin module
METKIKAKKMGGSLYLTLPKVYWEHMNVTDEQEIIISDEKGKYGNFIAIWNKKQQEE